MKSMELDKPIEIIHINSGGESILIKRFSAKKFDNIRNSKSSNIREVCC